jgi:membrane-associated protein
LELLKQAVDLFLHLDKHLGAVIADYGTWTYLIVFIIIFCETGLVVTPFLPGDSLLFAAGIFSGLGSLDITLVLILLSFAAIIGDTINYWIGKYIGPRAFTGKVRFLKKEYLDRTHRFYEKYGGKTIILARFIPIIRTFAPFVAGIGAMTYGRFIIYNVIGGVGWVTIFVGLGYIPVRYIPKLRPFLEEHFSLIVLAIIFISVLPLAIEFLRARLHRTEETS